MNFDDLFTRWPRQGHLSTDLGVSPQHLRMMRVRRSVPVRFWPRFVAAAARRGIFGVDYDLLVRLHAEEASQRPRRHSTPSRRKP
ncbi:hypothetical protein [Inquilinus sp. OTU3971]|uniref:hypothetical protein n=1 Tax=Inquilinus sp. OTU3971 TaxID=3043855 RepID=UPI00313F04FD